MDNYDPSEEVTDDFKDSGKKVKDFKCTIFIPQSSEDIGSLRNLIPVKSKKIESQNND